MEKKVLSAHIYVSTYSSVAFDIVSWPVTSREKIEPILFGLLGHYCFSQHIDHVLIDPAIHLHAQAKNPYVQTHVEPICSILGLPQNEKVENAE